ncbi:MAG: tripartite tricarboxylate transporter substrate binding protein [Syntrophaceae bacterium]|nr:tripartite tricarboxylate transporter substrate binding protein [Syntrophaceae bacterium]
MKGKIRFLEAILVSFLVFTGLAAAVPAGAAWPERPVTLLVGFAPGGTMDLSARALARAAEKVLGKPVVVENKTGGTGTVALAALLAQKADGYTLCATPSSVLIRVSQMQRVPFKPLASFRPILGFTTPQLGIVVKQDAPWKSLAELIAYAKKHPGGVKYATTGVGSTTHAAVEEIAAREKVRMIHIPYKGSIEALTALLGGHVDFASVTSEFIPSVKGGQARLLVTMGEKRSPKFPRVPTMKEAGYDFTNDAVYAVVAPAGLPPEVAKKIEEAFARAVRDREFLEALDRIDLVPAYYDAKAFQEFLRVQWKIINRHLTAAGLIRQAATPPE